MLLLACSCCLLLPTCTAPAPAAKVVAKVAAKIAPDAAPEVGAVLGIMMDRRVVCREKVVSECGL